MLYRRAAMARRVAVLGGGLQGACVALELARAGVAVDLFDRRERCLGGASAHNEGKIHLGFVYANDPSLATSRTMVRGAVAFAPLLRRWLGDAIDRIPVSSPFHYVVHDESMVGADEVERHLALCRALALQEGGDGPPDYFGSDWREPSVRLPAVETAAMFDRRRVRAAFRTPEVGIDSRALAALVRARLAAEELIACRHATLVRGVEPNGAAVRVEYEVRGGAAGSAAYDHVVNTLWDGRLAVDASAGLAPPRPWLYRLKHYVRTHAPGAAASIPSTTIVLGAYGDVVAYGDGGLYMSWYPAGLAGTSSAISPPRWEPAPEGPATAALRSVTHAELEAVIPAVGGLSREAVESAEVNGGVIFAWGETDIDDPASELHERHAIGPRSHGRYHSVDTGKLTMAPLHGKTVADRILAAA